MQWSGPSPRRRLLAVGLLLALVAGGLTFLVVGRSRFAWDQACTLARRQLPGLLGADVGLGRCEVDPAGRTLRIYGLSATAPDSDRPTFSADELEVTVAGVQPLSGRLELDRVRLIRPRIWLDLTRPQPPAKPEGGCPLRSLEHLEVDTLEVRGAEVRVALPGGRRVEVAGVELSWRTRRRDAEFTLHTSQGLVDLANGRPPLAVAGLAVEGALAPGGRELEVSRGELSIDDAQLSFAGRVDDLCRPSLALDTQLFLPMRMLSRVVPLGESSGHLWAQATLSGRVPDVRVTGELLGKGVTLGAVRPGDFTVRASLAGQDVTIGELSVPVGQGSLRASGELRLVPGLPLKVKADLDQVSLFQVFDRVGMGWAWVDLLATGPVILSGKLSPGPELLGQANLKVARFVTWSHPVGKKLPGPPLLSIPSGEAALDLGIHPDRVELLNGRVKVAGSRAVANVVIPYAGRGPITIETIAEPLVLEDVGKLADIPLGGVGAARVSVRIPPGFVFLDGELALQDSSFRGFALGNLSSTLTVRDGVLSFPDATGMKGRTAYQGRAALDFRGDSPLVHVATNIPNGRVEDLVEVLAPVSPAVQSLRRVVAGSARGAMTLEGPAETMEGRFDLDLSSVTASGRRLGDGALHARLDRGNAIALDSLALRGPLGSSKADGRWDVTGPLSGKFRVDGLQLEELLGPELAKRLRARGALTLAGTLGGTDGVPDVAMTIGGPQIYLSGRALGPMALEARALGEQLEVKGKPVADTDLRLTARIRRPYPYEATLKLALADIRALLPDTAAAQGLNGSMNGVLTASGNLTEVEASRGQLHLDTLKLQRGEFRAESDGPWDVRFRGGRLSSEGLRLKGPETELSASGYLEEGAMDIAVSGSVDLRLLESFVQGLDRTSGRLELLGSARGELADPQVVGTATLVDAGFRVRGQPLELRGLKGKLDFSESRILWSDLEGQANDGRLSSRGDVRWRRFRPDQLEVQLQLDQVSVRVVEDAPFAATGELTLTGRPGAFLLAGDLDVQRLRYRRPFAFDTLLARANRPSAPGEAPSEWLQLDVALHLKDAAVENNLARARIVGDLRLTGSNLHPGLIGAMEAGQGSQAFFRGTTFTLTQGAVDFKDRRSLEGVFDVRAESQVREYLIRLHAFGKTTQPQVLLSSEPSLPEGDIISLLTLGVTSRDRANSNTTTTGAGIAAEALYQASGLDQQVQKFLPRNSVIRDLSFHVSTLYNDANGLVEPTVQLESKFLTDQLKLGLSQPVSGKGTRALAEYRFDDRVSAQIQWDNVYNDVPIGNLGVDLKLRWNVE
jgi:translocation and assembly module TamB